MPANSKYLTKSPTQRFAKISAAIVGGYLVSVSLHLALAVWSPFFRQVFATLTFNLYLVWVALMIVPFMFKNGWKCWALYAAVLLVTGAAIALGKPSFPPADLL